MALVMKRLVMFTIVTIVTIVTVCTKGIVLLRRNVFVLGQWTCLFCEVKGILL